jgi:Ca2+-binding RTX toxin-like protein
VRVRHTSLLLSVAVLPVGWGLVPLAQAATLTCDGRTATLVGTSGPDELVGTAGADVIVGLGGDDRIDGGGGDDVLCGGAGKDRIRGGAGLDLLLGDDGDDILSSGSGTDGFLLGGAGDDRLTAQDANVGLYGEAGDDELFSTKPGTLFDGGDDADRIVGSGHADVIRGGDGDDWIDAAGGNDVSVHAGEGDDRVSGGAGNDVLHGDEGSDVCDGGTGSDSCHGGAPGTEANTPTDPDECTAETRTSCRGEDEGYPTRWVVHVEGEFRDSDEESWQSGTWTIDYVLRLGGRPTETWYVLESATGSWSGEGGKRSDDVSCSYAGSGHFDEEYWSADLQLFPREGEYFLDFAAAQRGAMAGSCSSRDRTWEIAPEPSWYTWEDSGEADVLPWDPSSLEIVGSETQERPLGTTTHRWTIRPVE